GRRVASAGEGSKVVDDELLMGRFRVLERIGSGGMGTVYRAFDERLQRHVAVKEIASAEPERVLREAQAAARLNHPGIVTLYELGERAGHAVLVSELVPGLTLARMRGAGLLRDRDVAEIAADLSDALAHAHARGVVHRDVKPENVIVRDDEAGGQRAKLMDFGIARIAGAPTLTAAGEVVGTLAYMSPEQADGTFAGPESDVYALALTAYECWSGENPIAAESPAQTVRRIGADMPPLRAYRPDLPPPIAEAIDACLAPEPELRPTAIELRDQLEAELGALDADRVVPLPEGAAEPTGAPRSSLGAAHVGALACLAVVLAVLAGPLGAAGGALVLAALCMPLLFVGAPAVALAPAAAPLLAAAGVPSASAALGVAGRTPVTRAILGVGAWVWLFAGSIALGVGPDLGITPQAADGWASEPAVAAEAILVPLLSLESLLGAGLFGLAAASLGWVLGARHVSIALLGAMLWAAAVDGGLSVIGNGALGGKPLGVVAAAALAVGIEFVLIRGRQPLWQTPRSANRSRPLTT
ncbi:MAG: protein kinase domain-containing protein, partial [Solirubrobacterales bacterium]